MAAYVNYISLRCDVLCKAVSYSKKDLYDELVVKFERVINIWHYYRDYVYDESDFSVADENFNDELDDLYNEYLDYGLSEKQIRRAYRKAELLLRISKRETVE